MNEYQKITIKKIDVENKIFSSLSIIFNIKILYINEKRDF